MALTIALVGLPSAAMAQTGPATVTIQGISPSGSFSPNGDGYDDTVTVNFCLDRAANVTATVTNAAREVIRTLANGVSHPGTCGSSLRWDGHDDSGAAAPDAKYTVNLEAVNASNTPTQDSVDVVVDRRVPGAVVAPQPGATLAGTAVFEFAPTDGFKINSVTFWLSGSAGQGCSTPSVSAPEADGVFRVSMDTAVSCGEGPRDMAAQCRSLMRWAGRIRGCRRGCRSRWIIRRRRRWRWRRRDRGCSPRMAMRPRTRWACTTARRMRSRVGIWR